MNVVLFGATGMIGQGVLRECLLDPDVQLVTTVGRTATGLQHPKLQEIVHANLLQYESIESQLTGFDACFFCLGVTSAGRSESEYTRITYDLTMAAAKTLARLNPQLTFVYVSGAGADSSEQGRTMWARVKGRTENALRRLPVKASYIVRPAAVQAMHGERSKTTSYRVLYEAVKFAFPLVRRIVPNQVATTEQIGRAMLHIAKHGAATRVLESADLSKY